MRRLLCLLLCLLILLVWPGVASAADFKINISISRQDDGTTCGELLVNDRVVWRIAVLADGAKPATSGGASATTWIAPDIVNGMFVIKISSE
ncbi:hypothetical protein [Sporolituus thermophilus]|uniref:Uncharacterized protein n=1 Tax=Sporolituus thermophilus DSM 23256 TaxID=1123285 RepID=A0A1G7PH92_9FIRM|nr:hypothetical protein [Sporolituus thermophilus]SDF85645.1 hypothetical protein SAMN05660235_02955 [Sporolituus thermophilus DSM 23256]